MASTTEEVSYTLPGDKALKNVSKIALVEDKKIMMDYWMESFKEDAFLGVRENGDKLLIKNEGDEYTSSITKVYKVDEEYLIVTENSIYLVSATIQTKRVA